MRVWVYLKSMVATWIHSGGRKCSEDACVMHAYVYMGGWLRV